MDFCRQGSRLADRIQARAIRRCGELLRQVEDNNRGRPSKIHDATDMNLTRTAAATQAGLSERQKVTGSPTRAGSTMTGS